MHSHATTTDHRAARRHGRTLASAVAFALGLTGSLGAVAQESAQPEEIVVTAQRRAQSILEVPISVTSYSPEQMDQQGIHGIEDVARLTPSLRFTKTSGVSGNNASDIAIRNVASDVGSATTAVYIDETPIQIRNIGYFGGNTFPQVFDLERIEVLRGPQGTLFGAGAEGGAVRFITPAPDFDKASLYARTELASVRQGGTTYEAGLAGGTPLGSNLAIRASVWYRHDAGYIDRYTPTGSALVDKDINDADNYTGRVALAWKATDTLTVTPSLYYQKIESNGRSQYWQNYTAPPNYVTGIYNLEPSSDRFMLPAVKVEWDLGGIELISNTSYFDRDRSQSLDYATFLSSNRTGNPFGFYGNKDTSNASALQTLQQKTFVQEVRLQSAKADQKIDWTAGAYYSNAKQQSVNMSQSGRIPGVISSGFPQYLNRFNLFDDIESSDKQYAAFGSLDVKLSQRISATLGLRYTKNDFNFGETRDGPVNGGRRTFDGRSQQATAVTPKVGLNFQVDSNNLIYASASKGFRPGGAQSPVDPTFCAADLATLGLTGSPIEYDSDSLRSYEIGTKNRSGGLMVDVNAYYTKWKNIQQSIRLPRCSFAFIANLGEATGRGLDVSLSWKASAAVEVGGSLGYNETSYDKKILGGNGLLIKDAGDRIGGPKWTGTLFAAGEKSLTASMTGYYRADYSFQSEGVPQNPAAFGYDGALGALPKTDLLTLRIGVRFSSFDVALYAYNVNNSDDPLARAHDTSATSLFYASTYTPRTLGVTAQYRF